MTHALVIAVFLVVFAADGIAPPDGPAEGLHLVWVAGGFVVVLGVGSMWIRRCAKRFASCGRGRWIVRAERAMTLTRLGAVGWHAASVLWLGALSGWRELFGPLTHAGDGVALALPLGVFLGTLGAFYPIERQIRESVMRRDASRGDPVRPVPSRASYVMLNARQQVGFVALPLACIYAWSLVVSWAWTRWDLVGEGTLDAVVHFVGAVGVFVFVPPLMRRVLDAVSLGPGALRESLVGLGRSHGVRFRDVLVWRTDGSQVNGAVMGLVAPLRYVMLTDGLLSALPEREIEGVMAHEVAHVRRHHILWLGLAIVGAVALIGTPIGWIGMFLGAWAGMPGMVEIVGVVGTLGAALVTLGFVSRRFEWQADAFAVKHLAGWRGRGAVTITPESALVMISALHRVAVLNGIDPEDRAWRHGSISRRTVKLRALVGRRSDRISIDREVLVVKVAIGIACLIGGGFVAAEVAVRLLGFTYAA